MLAWMLMLPFGIFLGATKKAFNQQHEIKSCFGKTLEFWFVIHRPLQAAGVLVMLIAIIIIFVANNAAGLQHMKYAHHFLGIVTFILATLQPIMAPIRKMGGKHKPKDTGKKHEPTKVRCVWHIIHALFGYGSQILAFATVFLGIQYVQNGPSSTQNSVRPLSIAGFSIVVAGFVFFLVLGFVWSAMDKARMKAATVPLEDPASTETKGSKPVKGVTPWPMAVLLTLLVVGSVLLWVDNFYPCQWSRRLRSSAVMLGIGTPVSCSLF